MLIDLLPSSFLCDSFDSEVTCVTWDPARRYVIVGLDSGRMHVYFLNEAWAEFTPVKNLTPHSDRVVAVSYDAKRDWLLSASRDKKLCIYNLKNFEAVTVASVGNAWYDADCCCGEY
jgi:WD40 repeat protein